VAIVTGASSGIGEASARLLARAGFRVVVAARREKLLANLCYAIGQLGGKALAVTTDLTDEDATKRLVDETLDAFGRIDVLVNNAGYSPAGAIEQLSRAEVVRTFQVNFFGGLQLVGEVAPVMRAQGGGRIINMSSMASKVAAPLAIPYAATKSAIEAAADGLRLELAPFKIHCSLIIPGFVDTATFDKSREMARELRNDDTNPYRKLMFDMDDFATANLQKSLRPDDVGRVVVRAATAKRPRARYYVPFSARLQSAFLGALPERVLDRILLRLYKVPAPGA
jgi:NAD(P)-dependent dehydrogenase (short-subunit alcohol dehydrogenase family)